MQNTVKVGRYRNTTYTVNKSPTNGLERSYEWIGSKDGKVDIKDIPVDVIDYLTLNTTTFSSGELKIIKDGETAEEIIDSLGEEYKDNSHTREEVIKLLEGNFLKMKSELSKITNVDELNFIINVAKEIKLDSKSKQDFIAGLVNMPSDVLFSLDEQ